MNKSLSFLPGPELDKFSPWQSMDILRISNKVFLPSALTVHKEPSEPTYIEGSRAREVVEVRRAHGLHGSGEV